MEPVDPFAEVVSVVASVDSLLIPAVGFARTISATAQDAMGGTVTGLALTWGVRDPVIAGVNASGRVEGREHGETMLIVAAGAVADTVIVTVDQVPETIEITQQVDTLGSIGQQTRLLLFAWDSAGAEIDPLIGNWSTPDETLAEINRFGRVDFQAAGTATFQWSYLGESASTTLTLRQVADFMWVYGGEGALAVGDTTTVLASLRDPENDDIAGAVVAWSSSDESVATVASSGLVTAVGGGNVVISGESRGLVGMRALSVSHAAPLPGALSVEPDPLAADASGQTFVLMAHVDVSGSPAAVPASWTSRDPDVATVSGSIARAVANGQTWLVADYDGRSDSVQIVVDRTPVALSFQNVPQEIGITYTDGVSVYPVAVDRLGGIIGGSPTWTVRDTTVITPAGSYFNAHAKGSSWAIAEVLGQTDSLHVTVYPRWHADYSVKTLADLQLFEDLGVEEMIGTLTINETVLTHIDGLESLETLEGTLWVKLNADLTDMDGLANLRVVTGDIIIEKNPALENPTLPALERAGSLSVFDNAGADESSLFPLLEVLDEGLRYWETGPAKVFPLLRSAGGIQVVFHGPDQLSFPALEVVTGSVDLIDVPETVVLSAPKLWRTQSMTIRGNSNLTTLTLTGLTTIQRELEVTTNTVLQNLSDLQITSGIRNVLISQNGALTSVSGLRGMGDALGSDPIVPGDLRIENNPALPSALVDELLEFIDEKFVGGAFLGQTATGGNG